MNIKYLHTYLLILCFIRCSTTAFAQNSFIKVFPHPISETEQKNVLKEIETFNRNYDSTVHLVKARASKHYHSDLDETYTIHHVLQSFNYAVALFDSDVPAYQKRGMDVLRACLQLQDTDPKSKTFGVWPYFLEEPFATKKSPPDRNWADFCSVRILRILNNHNAVLPADLQVLAKQALLNATIEIKERDIKPDYTNICLMGLHVCYMTALMCEDAELMSYAQKRLKDFYKSTLLNNGFVEYNSPAYTKLALDEVIELKQNVTEKNDLAMLDSIYNMGWRILAKHYHKPSAQWAGPHGRAYSVLTNAGFYNWLYTSSKGIIKPNVSIKYSLDEDRYLKHYIPPHYLTYFTDDVVPRVQVDTFIKANQTIEINPLVSYQLTDTTRRLILKNVIGKTYLTKTYALSSVNKSCLWDQRRAVLAYWGSSTKPNYMRIRFMHDNNDYAGANIFCDQDSTTIIGAVNFTTNGGDKHVSIDAIKNATIEASDLRLRFEFGGNIENLHFNTVDSLKRTAIITSNGLHFKIDIPYANVNNQPLTFMQGEDENTKWIDLVLYHGEKTMINFEKINEAVMAFMLQVSEKNTVNRSNLFTSIKNGQLRVRKDSLEVNVAIKPYSEPVSLLIK